MKRSTLTLFLAGLLLVGLWGIPDPNTLSERLHFLSEHNHTRLVPLPEELDLAGEAVPLDREDAQERLTKELLTNTYWHSNTLQLLKRSSRYFPAMQRILKEEGVPQDFERAVEYYRKAAAQGLADAQNRLEALKISKLEM